MVSKCANPGCSSIFRYLHEGKLFQVPAKSVLDSNPSRHDEFFWLCNECSKRFTIAVDSSTGAHIVTRLPPRVMRAAG